MITVGSFHVRHARYEDLDRVEELDRLFGDVALSREYFEAWLKHHPEGFLVAEFNERIYAYSMVILVWGDQISENWMVDTGGGTCSTHTPGGDHLYAVSIASQKPEAARALFIVSRRLFATSSLYRTVIFGRLPRFREWVVKQGYDPQTLTRPQKQKLLDRYISHPNDPYQVFYEGMNFMADGGVVDYLEGDEPSLNCALRLYWSNPYYRPLYDRAVVSMPSLQTASGDTRLSRR